jgi:hypothetical protein
MEWVLSTKPLPALHSAEAKTELFSWSEPRITFCLNARSGIVLGGVLLGRVSLWGGQPFIYDLPVFGLGDLCLPR